MRQTEALLQHRSRLLKLSLFSESSSEQSQGVSNLQVVASRARELELLLEKLGRVGEISEFQREPAPSTEESHPRVGVLCVGKRILDPSAALLYMPPDLPKTHEARDETELEGRLF